MASNTDGSVVIGVNMDISKANKNLAKLKGNIEKTERDISDITQKRDEAQQKGAFNEAALNREKAKLKEMQASIEQAAKAERELIPISEKISEMEKELLEKEQARSRVQKNIESTQKAIAATEGKLTEIDPERIASLNRELAQLEERQRKLAKSGRGEGTFEYDKNEARIAEIRKETDAYVDLAETLEFLKGVLGNTRSMLNKYDKDILVSANSLGSLREKADKIWSKVPADVASEDSIKRQEELIKNIQSEWNAATRETERYNKSLADAEARLNDQAETAGSLQQEIEQTERAREELQKNALVRNQKIVDMERELTRLKERQLELAVSGVGPGYQEYDQNTARIAELTRQLKEYQKALRGEGGEEGGKPEKSINRTALAAKKLNAILSGMAGALKTVGTAVSAVKKAGSALLSGAKRAAAFGKEFNALSRLSDSLSKKFKYFSRMLKRTFMTYTILKGLRAIREQVTSYLSVNAQLSNALRSLKGVFLTAFQPVYEIAVPALISLVNTLTRAVAAVTQFTSVLFGTTAKTAQENAKNLYAQANATAAAGSAAEEASRQMASFDEINQLTENKASGGGGGASADTGPLFDYEYEDTPFESWGEAFSAFLDKLLAGIPKLRETFGKFADWLNDFGQKLYDMFTFPGVLEKVKQLGRDLADALNELTDQIHWEILGRALGAGLNLALNFLTSFLYGYNWMNLGRHLAEFVNGLVDEIDWYEFGRLLWAGFKISLETLAGFLLGLNMPAMAEAASNIVKGFFTEMINTIQSIPWDQIGLQIATFINNIDWIGTLSVIATAIALGINAAITTLGTLIGNLEWAKIGEAFAASLNLLIAQINWAEIGQTLSDAFEGALTFLYSALSNFDWEAFGSSIGEFLASINWLEILTLLFDVIWEIISGLLEGLLSAIQTFWENADPFEKMLLGIAVAVGTVGAAITVFSGIASAASFVLGVLKSAISGVQIVFGLLTSPIGLVVVAITAAIAIIAVLITHFDGLREAALNAWEGIKEAFGKAAAWLNENLITPIVDGYNEHIKPVLEAFIEKLTEVVEEHVVPMVEKAIEFFGKVSDALKLAWDTILGPLVSWIIETAVPQIGNALESAGETFNLLLGVVSDVVGGILEYLGGVIDFLVGVFTGDWERVLNGLADIFKGVWNTIVGSLEGAVNLIITGINFLIGSLNNLHIDIPDNPFTGAFTLGFNIPKLSEISIPRLAQGAVIPPNREFLAVLGDQRTGTNIEAPVSEIENAVVHAMQKIGLKGGGNMTVVLQIEGREFGRAVVKYGDAEYQRVGVSLTEART